MIDDAINALTELQRDLDDAKATRVLSKSADGRTELWLHNGELTERAVTPPNRKHKVYTLDDMIALAGGALASKGAATLWINISEVTLIFDDADRRDLAMLPLLYSATWDFLTTRCTSQSNGFEQDEFVRILRTKLRHATNQAAVLAAVRKIKFRSLAAGDSSIQHGNESMGTLIENEVSGVEDIPDSLTVDTNVYSNLGEREQVWPVALDLEIIPKARRFKLVPEADEIERVQQAALASIRDRLVKGVKIPVYYGVP